MLNKPIRIRHLVGASLLCWLGCIFSAPLLAASGDLDTSFAGTGKVITAYGGITMFGPAVKLQSDGKIVVAGKHHNGVDDDFVIQRYLSSGALDTGFGTNGSTVFAFSSLDDNAKTIAFQSDGKILVAGEGHAGSSYGQHALLRLSASGAVDTSFGVGGKVTTNFGLPSHAHAVLVQSDGKIILAGEFYTSETNGSLAIARYLSDGTLDPSFGSGGKLVQQFGSNTNIHAITLLSDGSLLVAGYMTNASTGGNEFLVARYSTSGVLDTSFGINGYNSVAIGLGNNYGHAMLLQSDGKIVLTGGALTSNANDFALARFNSNGTLDTSFGSAGIVTTEFTTSGAPSSEETASGALQADGKIVVGGYSNRQFALARYLTSGVLDTSFGSAGKVRVSMGAGNDDFIKSLALQSDGKIVVAGFSKNAGVYNLALARFNNDGAAPASRLINLSTRGRVQTGDNVMIGGFILQGSTPKTVLIRAVGPTLASSGVPGVLANPKLDLYAGSTLIDSNDDWQTASNAAAITATALAPADALESAILVSLSPGAYTAIVSGVSSGTGVAIVEVYEIDQPDNPVINISTRGQVQTGDNVMIGGFIIQGSASQTVLIRAVGPNLANYGVSGVLANPKLDLYSGATVIDSNDDWQTASNAAAVSASGLAPVNPLESAILITLAPGAYTAIVSGADGGSGVGMVEVFAQ